MLMDNNTGLCAKLHLVYRKYVKWSSKHKHCSTFSYKCKYFLFILHTDVMIDCGVRDQYKAHVQD